MEEDYKYHIKPSKIHIWKLKDLPFHEVTSIRIILNITGKKLWEKEIPIFKMLSNLTGDEREFVKTGINIGTFDALFEDEDEDEDEDENLSDDEVPYKNKSG
jgi:hypothetical protein